MRLFGHPLHPMLVHFPIAFWSLGTGCDALGYMGLAAAWPAAAVLQLLGLAVALPAMTAGLVDAARLEGEAEATALRHMILMGVAAAAYLGSALGHFAAGGFAARPPLIAGALSATGFALMIAGGWYGAELVYRLGVGVRKPEARS